MTALSGYCVGCAVLLLAELQQQAAACFRGHFAVRLHFLQFIIVTLADTDANTHTPTHYIVTHPTGCSFWERVEEGKEREQKKRESEREKKRGIKGEKRNSLTSVLIITTVPHSTKVRLECDDSSLIKIQTSFCA